MIVSLVIGVTGAVLGIINTIHGLRKDKVKLKVRPWFMVPQDNPKDVHLCINVVNLGSFPVTVAVVGFTTKDSKQLRVAIMRPGALSNATVPHRLSSREDMLIEAADALSDEFLSKVKKVFATTACDETFYGTSKALKERIAEAEKHLNQKPEKTS